MSQKRKKGINVFVSSTFEDLEEYRKVVFEVIEKLKFQSSGMESFGARKERPIETCLREVRKCNVFVGIIGMRYGSIDKKSQKSFVHLEYETANDNGLDIRIYLIDENNALVHPKNVDLHRNASKLKKFKQLLRHEHTVETFVSLGDLEIKVKRDLENSYLKYEDLEEVLSIEELNFAESENKKVKLRQVKDKIKRFMRLVDIKQTCFLIDKELPQFNEVDQIKFLSELGDESSLDNQTNRITERIIEHFREILVFYEIDDSRSRFVKSPKKDEARLKSIVSALWDISLNIVKQSHSKELLAECFEVFSIIDKHCTYQKYVSIITTLIEVYEEIALSSIRSESVGGAHVTVNFYFGIKQSQKQLERLKSLIEKSNLSRLEISKYSDQIEKSLKIIEVESSIFEPEKKIAKQGINTSFFRDWLARNDLERFHVLTPAGRLLRVKKRFVFLPETLFSDIINDFIKKNGSEQIYDALFRWGYFWAKISRLKNTKLLLGLFSSPWAKYLDFGLKIQKTLDTYSIELSKSTMVEKHSKASLSAIMGVFAGLLTAITEKHYDLAHIEHSKEKMICQFKVTKAPKVFLHRENSLAKAYEISRSSISTNVLKNAIKQGKIAHSENYFKYRDKNIMFTIFPVEASIVLFFNDLVGLKESVVSMTRKFLKNNNIAPMEMLRMLEIFGFGILSISQKDNHFKVRFDNVHAVEGFDGKIDLLQYLLEGTLDKTYISSKLNGSNMIYTFE